MKDYRSVADTVAAEIGAGRLKAGERLPTQREFARQYGIANSTATRVYQELARRGLTEGHVGRGTFVRDTSGTAAPPAPALSEPAGSRIDLELNYPVVPEQAELLAAGLGGLLRPERLEPVLRPVGAAGTPA
ncbi:GntR family transcriptional regulator, partial [Streptomyces rhizosphaericola]